MGDFDCWVCDVVVGEVYVVGVFDFGGDLVVDDFWCDGDLEYFGVFFVVD